MTDNLSQSPTKQRLIEMAELMGVYRKALIANGIEDVELVKHLLKEMQEEILFWIRSSSDV